MARPDPGHPKWLEQPPAAGDVSSERGDGRTQAVTAPSRTVPTTELRGVVRDAAGTGVAGAMVLGWSRRESPTHLGEGRFDPPPHGSTETTADGSFRLRARGGVFHLLAVHGERMSTHGIIGVQEGRTEIEGLVFELAPTAVREGRLLDDAGEPVGGHEFGTDLSVDFSDELDRLDVPGFRRTKPPGLRVVTGTDGTFRARGLLEHSYPWEVKHPEHPMLRQRHAPKDGFLELRLETGERLAGIVFRADGSPAAGARAPQRLPSSGSRLRCRRPVRARRRGAPGRALPASCRISVHLLACCT